jgi:hypothetical protein
MQHRERGETARTESTEKKANGERLWTGRADE